jgi:hypothetical protein
MADYDLPIIESDKMELMTEKLMLKDKENTEVVLYKPLLLRIKPKRVVKTGVETVFAVVTVQKFWRRHLAKKFTDTLRAEKLNTFGEQVTQLGKGKNDSQEVSKSKDKV